ncbi:MAG: hypothetical protein LBE67_14295 [Kocuria palustris]|nr:hypothetical protein [Kocuria palustris]
MSTARDHSMCHRRPHHNLGPIDALSGVRADSSQWKRRTTRRSASSRGPEAS